MDETAQERFDRVGLRGWPGPAADFEKIAQISVDLLVARGLEPADRILDVGAGTLRIGRKLIARQDPGAYVGVEPAELALAAGARSIEDLVRRKRPRLLVGSRPSFVPVGGFRFALAQSVFSHLPLAQVAAWTRQISQALAPGGQLVFSWFPGPADYQGQAYAKRAEYRAETLAGLAEASGLVFEAVPWPHPRLSWAAMIKPPAEG